MDEDDEDKDDDGGVVCLSLRRLCLSRPLALQGRHACVHKCVCVCVEYRTTPIYRRRPSAPSSPLPPSFLPPDFRPTAQDVGRIQRALAADDIAHEPARCLPAPATQLYQVSE